jgi:hypothetical protein
MLVSGKCKREEVGRVRKRNKVNTFDFCRFSMIQADHLNFYRLFIFFLSSEIIRVERYFACEINGKKNNYYIMS